MKFYRSKLLAVILIVVILSLSVTACAGGQAGQEEKNKEIKMGLINWAENIAVANLWKLILEEEGYDVELVELQKQPLFSAVATGDVDLALEVWLPKTDKPFWEEYKDNGWERLGAWYEGTGLGLVVPEYVEVNSIEELNEHKEKFVREGEPTIVGIGGGASIMRMTKNAIETYNLDYNLVETSGPAMTAALDQAIQEKEPIVVTLWKPHWAFADYNLKFLEDPEDVYGGTEKIYAVAHQGFSDKFPTVSRYLNNWHMDDQSLGGLMSVIKDSESPKKGAKKWLEDNRDLVDSWLK